MKQINSERFAWQQFEKTGEIGAYLVYRANRAEREDERREQYKCR